MANYYFSLTSVSRSGGRSVVAKSRYIHAARGRDELRDVTFDYSGKCSELVHSEISVPENAPAWLVDDLLKGAKDSLGDVADASLRLWNSLDLAEEQSPHWRSKNAIVARQFIVSLPNELVAGENIQIMREFVEKNLTARGFVVDWAIHDPARRPGQDRNPHAHMLVSTRSVGADGWGLKLRDLDAPTVLRGLRFAWAATVNHGYERAGLDLRVDHRSLADQGIDLKPMGHNPYVAAEIEARGDIPYEKLQDMEARAENERRLLERPERIIALVSQKSRVFSAQYLREEFMKRVKCSVEQLEDALSVVMASPELVVAGTYGPKGEKLYTSQTRITQERQLVNQALELADDKLDVDAKNRIHQLSKGLERTQRAAAQAMLTPDRMTLVTGYAGTGKTYTIAEVAKVWRDRGYAVYGGAASGKATQELNGIVGLEAGTLAAWEARWARGTKMPKGKFVFIMDEAGMVGGDVWSRVQDQVAKQGGKFIAVGDAEQLPPVGDSGPFLRLQEKIGASVMDEVRRHKILGDREATTMFARGGDLAAYAIQYYEKTDRLHFVDDVASGISSIVDRYFADGANSANAVALALSNADVFALNDSLRIKGKALGQIDSFEVNLGRVARIERTEAGGEKRTYIDLNVATGDRLLFTKVHRELRIPKSSLATVLAVSAEGEMVLKVDGADKPVRIDTTAFNHFDYGFAVTVHKSQGMTVDRAYVLGHSYMNQHLLYVAMSRHRDHVEFFAPKNRINGMEPLAKIAQTKGYIVIDQLEDKPNVAMTPHIRDNILISGRADTRRVPSVGLVNFEGDPHVMGVSNRTAGLLAADHIAGDPHFVADVDLRYYENPLAVIDDLARMNSVFTATQVAEKLTDIILDPDTFITTFEKAMSHPALLVVDHETAEGGTRLYSTTSQIALEMEVIDRGVRLAMAEHAGRHQATGHQLNDSGTLSRLRSEYGLSDAQLGVMQHALGRDGLTIISGPSGSGKSSVAAALGAHLNADTTGQAIVLAPTGAGIEALRRAGAHNPMTFAQYARAVTSGALKVDKNTTFILDDAGVMSATDAQNLLHHVEARGMRIIALRDNDQIAAYGAGPVFEMLESRVGSFSLTETWRQHDTKMKAALDAIGKRTTQMQPMQGGAQLVQAGIIKAGETMHRSLDLIAADYLSDPAVSKIALTSSKRQASVLNERIRAALDNTMPARLETAVENPKEGSLDALRQGDKIKLLTAYKAANLRPGSTLEVLSRNARSVLLKVHTSDASELTLRLNGNPDDFKYRFAFAETVHAVKGQDIDSVHMLATTGMNRACLYTGMALHRHALNVVVPVAEEFLTSTVDAMVSTEGLRQGALDYSLDVSMAAREATRNRINPPELSRIQVSFEALKGVLGVTSSDPVQQTPPDAVIAESLSEVITGHIIEGGKPPSQELQADYVQILGKVTDKRAWKLAQSTVGQDMSEIAYKVALDRAGPGSDSAAMPVAVALSRSATLATATGQTDLANRFQRALDIYGARADEARRTVGIEALEVYAPNKPQPIDPLPSPAPTRLPAHYYTAPYVRGANMPTLRSLSSGNEATIIRQLLKELSPPNVAANFIDGVMRGWQAHSPRGPAAAGPRIGDTIMTAPGATIEAPKAVVAERNSMLNLTENMEDALVSAFTRFAETKNAAHDAPDMKALFRQLHEKAKTITDTPSGQQKVEELANSFATERAVNDLRVRLAYQIRPNAEYDWREGLCSKTSPFFVLDSKAHAEFGRRFNQLKDQVTGTVTDSDRALAKLVLAADKNSSLQKSLAKGIAQIAEFSTIQPEQGASVRADRQAFLEKLHTTENLERLFVGHKTEDLTRLYNAFTLQEITVMAQPKKPLPPSLDDMPQNINRTTLAGSIIDLMKNAQAAPTTPRHNLRNAQNIHRWPRLGLQYGPEKERERGRYLG